MYRTSLTSQSTDVVYSLAGGSDYQEISEIFLAIDDTNRQRSFSVAITDDSLFELDSENFTLELRFNPFEILPPSNVILFRCS